MANPAQLTLTPFLKTHYPLLWNHPDSTLKHYYSQPDLQIKIETIYREACKNTVPKAAATGGTLGLVLAWMAGLGMPGTALSIVTAGVGGAAAGALYEAKKLSVAIRLDDSYKNWKASIEKPILNDFNTWVDNYEPFEDCVCGISFVFPEVPVRDHFGRLFNQVDIFKWIDENGTHPVTRQRMSRKDVVFCQNFAAQLKEKMEALFRDDVIATISSTNPDKIIEGLKRALHSIINNHNRVVLEQAAHARKEAELAGLPIEEVDRIYQVTRAGFINRPIFDQEPKGLTAILTAETQELQSVILKEAPHAIRSLYQHV